LYCLTDDPIIRSVAAAAIGHALSHVDRQYGDALYAGRSGIALATLNAGAMLDREDFTASGLDVLTQIARREPDPTALDVVGGSAGIIPLLLNAGTCLEKDELIEGARRHGDLLLERAMRSGSEWSWDTMGVAGQPPLAGYSHGASGIALALMELGVALSSPSYIEGAIGGIAYERRLFSATQCNWPDLRLTGTPGAPSWSLAWCHGAPGIGMARLRMMELLGGAADLRVEAEIAISAVAPTLTGNFDQTNCSLCHGAFGNADLLLSAASALGRPELRTVVERMAKMAIDRFERSRSPWPCGVQGAGETPGLMLGLAGIGYFLLRLYDPDRIPSVLLFPGAVEAIAPQSDGPAFDLGGSPRRRMMMVS
jgi:lantibiotic modifying enzyme